MTKFYTNKKSITLVVKATYVNSMNGYPVVVQGERLKFENGELFLDEKKQKDSIEFIRNHKDFGIKFFEDFEETSKPKTRAKAMAAEE